MDKGIKQNIYYNLHHSDKHKRNLNDEIIKDTDKRNHDIGAYFMVWIDRDNERRYSVDCNGMSEQSLIGLAEIVLHNLIDKDFK